MIGSKELEISGDLICFEIIIYQKYYCKGHLTHDFKKSEFLFTGDGGHAFKSGIESQMIRAGPGNSLGLISPTGRLNINGPQKIDFHSFAGPINVHALKHIHLRARRGNVSTIIILNGIFTI